MGENSYWFADADDEDLGKILDAIGIRLSQKLYSSGELLRLKTKIDIF